MTKLQSSGVGLLLFAIYVAISFGSVTNDGVRIYLVAMSSTFAAIGLTMTIWNDK